jgi:hypothetical protein
LRVKLTDFVLLPLEVQVAASLALGAAAVGAGVWLYRRYWIEGGDAEKERSQEEGDKEHKQHRKDLRRKRADVPGRYYLLTPSFHAFVAKIS